jgi:hypothetical protein
MENVLFGLLIQNPVEARMLKLIINFHLCCSPEELLGFGLLDWSYTDSLNTAVYSPERLSQDIFYKVLP